MKIVCFENFHLFQGAFCRFIFGHSEPRVTVSVWHCTEVRYCGAFDHDSLRTVFHLLNATPDQLKLFETNKRSSRNSRIPSPVIAKRKFQTKRIRFLSVRLTTKRVNTSLILENRQHPRTKRNQTPKVNGIGSSQRWT